MKRVLLFLGTNIAILVVLSVVLNLLGVESILDEQGVHLDMRALLIFCTVFGMGGSFISLALSKWMAKRAMGVQVIEQPRNDAESWLFQTVSHQAQAAGIGMPEIGIFDSPQPNAFATGARKDAALVAVSSGLLRSMDKNEVEAVLGHEVSHVANGDMVTLALIQGVLNTFVLFLSRLVGFWVDRVILKNERGYGLGFFLTTLVAQIVFGVLASVIVMWFSRRREFRADAGGARLAGRENMIGALERLKSVSDPQPLPEQMAAFGISGGRKGFARLFTTHPPLEERIEALKRGDSRVGLLAVAQGADARQDQAHQLALAAGVGLGEDLLELAAGRVDGDAAPGGGLLQRVALGEQAHQVRLGVGELVDVLQHLGRRHASALRIGDEERGHRVAALAARRRRQQRRDHDDEGPLARGARDRREAGRAGRLARIRVEGAGDGPLQGLAVAGGLGAGPTGSDPEPVLHRQDAHGAAVLRHHLAFGVEQQDAGGQSVDHLAQGRALVARAREGEVDPERPLQVRQQQVAERQIRLAEGLSPLGPAQVQPAHLIPAVELDAASHGPAGRHVLRLHPLGEEAALGELHLGKEVAEHDEALVGIRPEAAGEGQAGEQTRDEGLAVLGRDPDEVRAAREGIVGTRQPEADVGAVQLRGEPLDEVLPAVGVERCIVDAFDELDGAQFQIHRFTASMPGPAKPPVGVDEPVETDSV